VREVSKVGRGKIRSTKPVQRPNVDVNHRADFVGFFDDVIRASSGKWHPCARKEVLPLSGDGHNQSRVTTAEVAPAIGAAADGFSLSQLPDVV
jgi:hypothetical protein